MLTTNADDAFVVLIGYMEGYRSRHLLLHKIKAVLGSFILRPADIDVEIVFIEAIEDDLYIAYATSVFVAWTLVENDSYFGP